MSMTGVVVRIRDLIESLTTNLATVDTVSDTIAAAVIVIDTVVDAIAINAAPRKTGVLPSLGNEKTLTGGAGAWAQGSWVEIAASVGASDILVSDIHVVAIAAGLHHVELGIGAAAAEVALCARTVSVGSNPMTSVRVPAGSRLAARNASKAGGSETLTCNVVYQIIS